MDAVDLLKNLGQALLHAGLQSLNHLLLLALPLLLPAFVMQMAASLLEKQAVRTLGARPYLFLFAWLGTAVHELGHAFFHLIFGHRITQVKLFTLDPQSETLGYVRFEFQPGKLRHRIGLFFAAMGPILAGTALILLAAHLLTPGNSPGVTGASAPALLQLGGLANWLAALPGAAWELGRHMLAWVLQGGWRGALFVWLAFSVGSSVTLSPADLRLAARGSISLIISLFVLHGVLMLLGVPLQGSVHWLAHALAPLTPLLLVVAGLNIFFWLVLKIVEQGRALLSS